MAGFPNVVLQSQGLLSLIGWSPFIPGLKIGILQVRARITTDLYVDTFYLMTSVTMCNNIKVNMLDGAGNTPFFTHNYKPFNNEIF